MPSTTQTTPPGGFPLGRVHLGFLTVSSLSLIGNTRIGGGTQKMMYSPLVPTLPNWQLGGPNSVWLKSFAVLKLSFRFRIHFTVQFGKAMTRRGQKRSWKGDVCTMNYTEPNFQGIDIQDPWYAPDESQWNKMGQYGVRQQYNERNGLYFKDWDCSYPTVFSDPVSHSSYPCEWYLLGIYWIPRGDSPWGCYREIWAYECYEPMKFKRWR